MARRYAERGETRVIACCRKPDSAESLEALARTHDNIVIEALDVANPDSILRLASALGDTPVDVLINNAGIFGKNPPATTGFDDQVFGNSDYEADWLATFRVNVIGPMRMVEALVENVAQSAQKKIVVVTSIVGSLTYAQGHMFGYAASKAAANMTARNLAIALKPRGIIVNPIHPGYAKTDMGGEQAHVDVDDAVRGVLEQIDGMSLDASGQFLSYDGAELPW